MGAPAGAPSWAATAAAGLTGRQRAANAHRGGGSGRPARPIRGDRRLQTNRGAGATRARHGGSGGVADERGRSGAAGPFAEAERTRDGAGGGLAAGGVGAAFPLRAGGVGAPVRPQRALGIAAAGAGGAFAGGDSATGARGQDRGAGGHEVPRAGSPPKRGGLPADGGDFRGASLRYAGSGPTVCRLAARLAHDSQTHSGRSRIVFQNAAASAGESPIRDRRRTVARSGDGGRDREPRTAPAGGGRSQGTGSPAKQSGAVSDRSHSKTASPHGRRNPTGGKTTC